VPAGVGVAVARLLERRVALFVHAGVASRGGDWGGGDGRAGDDGGLERERGAGGLSGGGDAEGELGLGGAGEHGCGKLWGFLRFEGGGAYIKIAMNRILAEDTLGFFFFGFGRFELSVEEWIEWTSQTNNAAAMKIENGGKIETGQTDTVWK
jgi:hypothetical protein